MKFIKGIRENKFIYWIILTAICFLFFYQAFSLAHQLPSRVDEGSFLIKGYFFISGKYKPFEDYGPWTNNMPLAYLIPGIPQFLFGPGLKVGRYFAVFITFITLTGFWVLINRLRGRWWSLAAVLGLSINPSWIGMNVQAVSQGIVACLVTWMMVFLLGDERKIWHIGAAAFLSAMATLTRQNMVFLLPFVVLYAWWRYGLKEGVVALLFSFIPFAVVHGLYYPKIMNLWYPWLPGSIKSIFNIEVIKGGGSQVWQPGGDMIDRLSSFFIAVKSHLLSLIGVCLAFPLIFRKKNWRSEDEWKMVISLLALFSIFLGLHAWASLTKNYCIFCFPNYVAFFIPLGTIISVLTISNLTEKKLSIPTLFIVGLVLILVPGIFFGSLGTVGRWVMKLPVPRIKDGKIIGGVTQIYELIRNRFNMPYEQQILIVPPVFGLMISISIIIILFIGYKLINRKYKIKFGIVLSVGIYVFSMFLTPTYLLGKFPYENACNGDVISAYEKAGDQLQSRIPDGSSI
jgi:4-amino-4-deoxy-L-arabinose transferase-like glycosyltransferase